MYRVLGLALLAVATGCSSGPTEGAPPEELRVRRGAFANDVVLSGELEAARGVFLTVPPMPSWQTAIKWIVEDGTAIKAGDRVAELDSTALSTQLETKRQDLIQTAQELQQRESEWAADLAQKALEADKRRSELEKATIDAAVPADLLARSVYEQSQSALRRATVEYEKAAEVLASRRVGIDAERRNLELRIEKARREIARTEEAISGLVLQAPRDGIVVIRDYRGEPRKLQAGDAVWVGSPIAMIPELSSVRVSASLADVDDGKIAIGMPAVVALDGYPGKSFAGRVDAISAVAQESRRMSLRRHFDVLIALDQVDTQTMRPGLSARVAVRRESVDTALLVPRAAIDFSGTTAHVKLASGAMRDVKLGACNGLECVAVDGVREQERLAGIIEGRRE